MTVDQGECPHIRGSRITPLTFNNANIPSPTKIDAGLTRLVMVVSTAPSAAPTLQPRLHPLASKNTLKFPLLLRDFHDAVVPALLN